MSKLLKGLMRDELKARFDGVDGGIFISTQGLNSEKTYALRSALHGRNIQFTVVSNALARQAFRTYGFTDAALDIVLDGPVGVVYTQAENSAPESARAIADFKKQSRDRVIQWRGAFMDGEILDAKDAALLKDAPTKEQARAQLLGAIQAPIPQLLATIREPYARVVYALNALHDKRAEK